MVDKDDVPEETDEDYTDYRRMKWEAVEFVSLYWPATLRRLPVLLVITGIGGFVAHKIDLIQTQIYKGELFVLMMFYWVVVVLTLNTIWYWLVKALGNKLIHYQVNKQGVVIGSHTYLWKNVDHNKIKETVGKYKKPLSDNKLAPPRRHFVFPIVVSGKKKMLVFENEVNRQKFITAIESYLQMK